MGAAGPAAGGLGALGAAGRPRELTVVGAVVRAVAGVVAGVVGVVARVVGVARVGGAIIGAVAGLGDARHRERGDDAEREKSLGGARAHWGFLPVAGAVLE
jgi:hypothetical protein